MIAPGHRTAARDEITATFDANSSWWHHILAAPGGTATDLDDSDDLVVASEPDAVVRA